MEDIVIDNEYLINEIGMIECLHCGFITWSSQHRCWQYVETGTGFTDRLVPPEVDLISKERYELFRTRAPAVRRQAQVSAGFGR